MKKILSIILTLCLIVSTATIAGATKLENPFIDVAEDAWYYEEVVKAVDTGIINGKTPTEFYPEDLLTYAEAVKLAACMNQVYLYGEVTLSNGEPWYKPYADYCKENRIIEKEYNYEENATRAGYMEIFANALPDSAYTEINNIPNGSILDVKNNAPYAIYVYKLYRAGIVTGVDELHNCNPDENIKRCEVATIISRMMDDSKRKEFDMPIEKLSNENTFDSPDIENLTPATPMTNPNYDEIPEETPGESPEKPNDDPILDVDDIVIPETDNTVVVDPVKTDIDITNSELTLDDLGGPLSIDEQPKGSEEEEYGTEYELFIKVKGGKAPYTFEWYVRGFRNSSTLIAEGDYVKAKEKTGDLATDVLTNTIILSVEKENTLLGESIYCKVTDSEGTTVSSDNVKVYGPFLMPAEDVSIITAVKEYLIVGRIAEGVVRKGDKLSVERNGKIIAIGTAKDIQMFNKSLDMGVKNDNIGLTFELLEGVKPDSGDIVIKYKDGHVIDTSDIIN